MEKKMDTTMSCRLDGLLDLVSMRKVRMSPIKTADVLNPNLSIESP